MYINHIPHIDSFTNVPSFLNNFSNTSTISFYRGSKGRAFIRPFSTPPPHSSPMEEKGTY